MRGRSGGRAGGAAPSVPLEAQIIAKYSSASWDVPFLFLARPGDVTKVATKVSNWTNLGTGPDLAQATDAQRPVYTTGGVGTGDSLTFSGAQWLDSASLSLTTYTAFVLSIVYSDTDTALRYVVEYGAVDVARSGMLIRMNNPGAGALEGVAYSTVGQATGRSASSYPMTSPSVVSCTWDSALSTDEAYVRHGGADVTTSHPDNANNTTAMLATEPLVVGARHNHGSAFAGEVAAVCLAAGSTAVPTTQVASVESLLLAEWGL